MRAILHHRFIRNNAHARRLGTLRPSALADSNFANFLRKTTLFTFACDSLCLTISIGLAWVFRTCLLTLWPDSEAVTDRAVASWVIALALIGQGVWFLGLDTVRRSRPAWVRYLPFSYARAVTRYIYVRRLEISLWTIATSSVLLLLCLLAAETSLFSKLFLSSLVALVIFAIRKSIPVTRISVGIAIGAFLIAVLTIVTASLIIL